MAIESTAEARELLRRQGVVALTRTEGVTSLVDAIAGEEVKGTWWSHAKGNLIYAIASELEDDPTVLSLKLIAHKVTFVDQALWPALYAVATNEERVAAARKKLPADAKKLFAEVEEKGVIRLDSHAWAADKQRMKKAKEALERAVLAISASMHTESGKHATTLRSFHDWADRATEEAAARLSTGEAREVLATACRRDPFG